MCYNNSVKKETEGIKLSPEQTIIIAKMCDDYKKGSTFKYPADYIKQYASCKNCTNWQVGRCEKAQDILNTLI